MSSLGHPVSSRYPFQFRQPTRGTSFSSGVPSHATPPSNGHSIVSRFSQGTRSTGNRESTDSHSPRSQYTTSSSDMPSPMSMSGLPMPPRHPHQGRGRARAGTVPAPSVPSSPSIDFPRRSRAMARTSEPYNTSSPEPAVGSSDIENFADESRIEDSRIEDSILEQPEPEGSQEAAEGEDVVGLLSPSRGPSPKTSFTAVRHRARTISSHRGSFGPGGGSGSRSGSSSRTNSHSGSSSSGSRSRPGSISIAMTSRPSARCDPFKGEFVHGSAGGGFPVLFRSDTFTVWEWDEQPRELYLWTAVDNPMAIPRRASRRRGGSSRDLSSTTAAGPAALDTGDGKSQQSPFSPSLAASGDATSHPSTMVQELRNDPSGLNIPGPGRRAESMSSHPDISTAAASFVTAPATVEGSTTDESGRTPPGWGGITHMVDRSEGTWRPA
ncbi:hypothetical protein D9757_008265 [Collybiopsis confluens]|uniref:Uncharacterized protein n=1 Tax=Collybiopsis confluens TaxID=2823264 RepID=A0A8H5H4E1_9AGAR|nr:hypothetical protein D9757_008265 [Collybiopsis confluens]